MTHDTQSQRLFRRVSSHQELLHVHHKIIMNLLQCLRVNISNQGVDTVESRHVEVRIIVEAGLNDCGDNLREVIFHIRFVTVLQT